MRVSIIGAGYVGLVSGVGLAEIGHDVICVDREESRIQQINDGHAPIFEPGLNALLASNAGKRLRGVTSIQEAIQQTDLTIIAVGTPFDGERIELDSVADVSEQIGGVLATKDGYHTVVVKSTVVPGTTDSFVLPLLERTSQRRAGIDFGVGMNPEFLREGQAMEDFMNPDRLVLGGIDGRTHEALLELYEPFTGAETLLTSNRTAEMIKYAANSLFATLISFSNEIASVAAEAGVDAMEVMDGVHLDKRLTPIDVDGSRMWPGLISYLVPGCGFGGSCFPKDVKSFIAFGEEHGAAMPMMRAVMAVNAGQPAKVIELLQRHVPDLDGVAITVLGIAFKPETSDIRESPSLEVIRRLLQMNAVVTVYDPEAHAEAMTELGSEVAYAEDLESAVTDATGILLMTRWSQFERVPELLRSRTQQPVVVDGRRMLASDSVATYEGIGR